MNAEYLGRERAKAFFIHTIVPRITIAHGSVLKVSHLDARDGIDPDRVIAGSGIVKAYRLEKESTGGLLTMSLADALRELPGVSLRGDASSMRKFMVGWLRRLAEDEGKATIFARGRHIDFPWLLFRPFHDHSHIWCAQRDDALDAAKSHLKVWRLSEQEFAMKHGGEVPVTSTKHAAAALRHGRQSVQACDGEYAPRCIRQ